MAFDYTQKNLNRYGEMLGGKKKEITVFSKPQNVLKFLLYLKNLNFLHTKKLINFWKREKKSLEGKKFNVRCRLATRRWNYMQPTLLQKLYELVKIFKANWTLCNITKGIQKTEIKIKTKRDLKSEQQFNEFPAMLLLLGKTFEYIGTKGCRPIKFTQELFFKNKAIKAWVKRYKLITYVSKTSFWGESFVTNFFSTFKKILSSFPKMFFRKTKLLDRSLLNVNIFNFWTWSILDNVQVNPSNLGLKNIYVEPINIVATVQTIHKTNTTWHLCLFLVGLGFRLCLKRMSTLIMRYIFSWYAIKSKILTLPFKFSAIFVKKIKKNKLKKKYRNAYMQIFKRYLSYICIKKSLNFFRFKNRFSCWLIFKRMRLLVSFIRKKI